jgi:hypothetical protein
MIEPGVYLEGSFRELTVAVDDPACVNMDGEVKDTQREREPEECGSSIPRGESF